MIIAAVLSAAPAFAGFINGGFEDGNFGNWTKDGGSYSGSGTYSYTGDPGKSAIVTQGKDYYSGNNLDMVYGGTYAARVNNYDWNFHFSTISQTVTNWQDEKIYFAWAAVLENPGHSYAGHFSLTLMDINTNTALYDIYFDYYSAGTTLPTGTWKDGISGWKYSDWQVVDLDTSAVKGHDLMLTLLASDCAAGGHGGYAYLDGFGAAPPIQGGEVPEPATMLLLGFSLFGLAGISRKFKK